MHDRPSPNKKLHRIILANRHLGSKVLPVSASAVDTGDLLETR